MRGVDLPAIYRQAAADAGVRIERLQLLQGEAPSSGAVRVVYWMQTAQRETCNHALEVAAALANRLDVPLMVFFGIDPDFYGMNQRNVTFMLEGLTEMRSRLAARGITLSVRSGDLVTELCHATGVATAAVVTDCGYLPYQRQLRQRAGEELLCPLLQVETEVMVPVAVAGNKEEYMARTIRAKLMSRYREFIVPPVRQQVKQTLDGDNTPFTLTWNTPDDIFKKLQIDRSVGAVDTFHGGYAVALTRLNDFIASGLPRYVAEHHDPNAAATSRLSPYLHFGQIFAGEVCQAVEQAVGVAGAADFIEELLVRRELAVNFAIYNPNSDNFHCLPEWAVNTLRQHCHDPREHVYTPDVLERAETHDSAWNAAQTEMVRTGYMSSYMRMYWGKKIMEWIVEPEEAYNIILQLNNKYELDGRDPNALAGVAWCFGKHDRPWPERPIYGTVRSMTYHGLSEKFDLPTYIARFSK